MFGYFIINRASSPCYKNNAAGPRAVDWFSVLHNPNLYFDVFFTRHAQTFWNCVQQCASSFASPDASRRSRLASIESNHRCSERNNPHFGRSQMDHSCDSYLVRRRNCFFFFRRTLFNNRAKGLDNDEQQENGTQFVLKDKPSTYQRRFPSDAQMHRP